METARIGAPSFYTRAESWKCDFNDHWNTRFHVRAFQLAAGSSDPVPIVPPPARLARGGVEMSRPPLLGEHGDALLASYGFGREEIDRLREAGTV